MSTGLPQTRRFFAGEATLPDGEKSVDIAFFRPDGTNMRDADWDHEYARSMMVFLNGDAIRSPTGAVSGWSTTSFLIAFNAHHETLTSTIPDEVYGEGWLVALDTSDDEAGSVSVFDDATTLIPGVDIAVAGRSVLVPRRPRQASR